MRRYACIIILFSFLAVFNGLTVNEALALKIGANYGAGWNLDAKNAFFTAETLIASQMPTAYKGEAIVIDASWAPLDSLIGGARLSLPFQWWNNFGSSRPEYQADTWYPAALANHLHGSDLSAATEMTIIFNSNRMADFYFGLDGKPPQDKIDFVFVAMHEIVHGLGFGSIVQGDGRYRLYDSLGNPLETALPSIYDRFVEADYGLGNMKPITFMDELERAAAVISDEIFWGGQFGIAGNTGQPIELYAPFTFAPGSSVSHLDLAAFPNELMRPKYAPSNFPNHSIGLIELGMLKDIGWIAIPEPSTLLLLGSGLAGIIVFVRKKLFKKA